MRESELSGFVHVRDSLCRYLKKVIVVVIVCSNSFCFYICKVTLFLKADLG